MSKRRRTSSKAFTSDAEVILQFLEEMSSDDDSGSDSDFDGYVEDFDEDYARIECTDFQGIAKYKVPAAARSRPAGSSSARDLSPGSYRSYYKPSIFLIQCFSLFNRSN